MPKKILIVDDEISICDALRRFFKDKGYVVFTSQEAGEAVGLLKKEKPGILILDIKMPGLNGMETLRFAKEINKNIRVIILTAIKDEFILKEAMDLGASSYLTKPFKLEELEKAVSVKTKGSNEKL
ncbi:MAG: response regulator [Candidatus Omnitrophica bacterium]|nr:response regulator [Candidatus Omnitrophota bacterium]